MSEPRCVHEAFEVQVEKTPDAAAVSWSGGLLSYAELNARANALAHHLRALGVRPDHRVALCLERGPEMLTAALAVLKAGGAYVPLDPSYPDDRLEDLLDDAAPLAVVARRPLPGAVPVVDPDVVAGCTATSRANPSREAVGLQPSHLAYLIYTSGSTGKPKGVMIEHRGLWNYLQWAADAYAPDHGAIVSSSLSFDATVTSLYTPLLRGATVRLLPERQEIEGLQKEMQAGGLVKITPSHLDVLGQQMLSTGATSAVHTFVVGGEALAPATIRLWRHLQPNVRIVNEYGPTETVVGCATYAIPAQFNGQLIVPIGRPIANTKMYVLGRDGRPAPIGVTGEIFISGPGVARGYWNDPELTAERFLADPFRRGQRMYKTGDLGRYLPDGQVEYLGRNDFQLKLRGYRIEAGEIEARLLERDDVREAVVVLRGARLTAYVVASMADAEELRRYLSARLPEFMVPAAFVWMEALPLTPNGKIDRGALPDPDAASFAAKAYEPPQGDVEMLVAGIWTAVLGIGQVGRRDDFFALGGHSLLAVQVISRLREFLGVEAALGVLFAHPVLADFASALGASDVAPALPPIAPAPAGERGALSFAQERLWFLSHLEGVSERYHIPFGVRLRGALHPEALRQALDRLIERHEVLRTTFVKVGNDPVQRIGGPGLFALLEHQLADGEAFNRLREEEAAAPFDLEHGPLIRGRLIRHAGEDHTLLITMHHIVSDGWSMEIMLRELGALYAAFAAGDPDPLEPLPVQYADYAAWQRRFLTGDVLRGQADHWRETLASAPVVLNLPADRPRPQQQDYTGGTVEILLGPELAEAIRAVSRRHGVTPFMTVLASWALLMARLSGQDDVVIGAPVANRGRAEIEGLIGFFVNTLPLRIDVSDAPSVTALLARVKAQVVAAQQNQDIPFEQVVEIANPVRSLAHNPLFQVTLVWQTSDPRGGVGLGDLALDSGVDASTVPARFDLSLTLHDAGKSMVGALVYAAALFDRSTAERYLRHWRTLLEAMVADDRQSVDRLPLLTAGERREIVDDWSGSEELSGDERFVQESFELQAAKRPHAVAVVHGGFDITYGRLNSRANQLAHALRELGVQPDDRVAVLVDRGIDMVVALLAVLKAGGAYVPIDPSYPAERIRSMIEDSAPVAVLAKSGAAVPSDVPLLDVASTEWASRSSANPSRSGIDLRGGHLAYVIYTSGSTGRPKGAGVAHDGLANLLRWYLAETAISSEETVLVATSFSFDLTQKNLLAPLLSGARLVLAAEPFDARAIVAQVARESVRLMNLTPSAFHALLDATEDGELDGLRLVVLGGEPMKPRRLAALDEPRPDFMNGYGPTECTAVVAFHRLSRDLSQYAERPVPLGRPIPNARLYILDRHLQPVPAGVAGELYIGGTPVGRGYLGRPDWTAERFLPNPFRDGRMYRTGDLARWLADGTIEFLGRNDDQVKIRGFRVELGEIESRLTEHPAVEDAVVVSRDERLVAYVVSDAEQAALREHLLGRVPEFMIPAAFVRMEALPLTRSGKVDRRALPDPDGSSYVTRAYEPPHGETETAVAEVWASLLKLERIGRDDDFFELGGHSLLILQVISRLRQILGVEVALPVLFASPVLKDFAAAVARAGRTTLPPIAPAADGEQRVLSFAQQRLWFLESFGDVGTSYHVPVALRLNGPLDAAALRRTLDRIVARHEVLRTTFGSVDGEPVQRVAPAEEFALIEHDLRGRVDAAEELVGLSTQEAAAPFDLARGPLIRGRLVRMDDEESILLLTMHHIVSDGWSGGVLTGEITALYTAFLAGRPDPLPPLPVQYGDYAIWQRRWLDDDVLRPQAEYWQSVLSGALALLTLPIDRPRPPRQDYAGASLPVLLDAPLAAAIRALSQRHHATLHMTLLASWAAVLSRLAGQETVVIGTPVANRGRAEIEGLIGFFVNTLALPIDLSGAPTVGELLARVKTRALEAQQNQDVPFEQVVELVRPPRNLSHSPLFQVLFAWQNAPAARLDLPGLALAPIVTEEHRPAAKFDLALSLGDRGDAIEGELVFATSLFDRATVSAFLGHWRTFLEAMVADDAARVAWLPLLTPAERHRIVEEWNATGVSYPSALIHELFERQAERTPDVIAVTAEGESVTYAELNARADALAGRLRAHHVKTDDRVAVCLERSVDMVASLLGVLKAGAAYVPLDPLYPTERLAFMLRDCAPAAVLTGAGAQHVWSGLRHVLPPHVPVLDAGDVAFADKEPRQDRSDLTDRHLAYVIYTSGSTGRPKGVMNEHRGVVNRLLWMQQAYGLDECDRVLQKTPFSFDVSVWEFFWPLLTGARLVMARPEGHKDPAYLVETIRREAITTLHFVPSMLQAFVDAATGADCPALTRVVCSGEALPAPLVERFHERFPRVELHNLYGPTEAAVDVTAWTCVPGAGGSGVRGTTVPIGRPVANTRIYVLDGEGEPVPVGVAGELHIGGVQVARGYLHRPELTAEKFVPDPFAEDSGARMYKTGDLVRYRADGVLEYLGRSDGQVKLRGFRIEFGEIEACLTEHPGVRETAVVAADDPAGQKRLVAYFVAGAEAPDADALRQHLIARLPDFMVPAAYVRLDALPLTPNGKLDRNALPSPEGDAFVTRAYEPPEGGTETTIASIWSALLGLERVGRHDNFFELGGHSLLAVTLMERLRACGLDVDVRAIFTAPTVAGLAGAAGQGVRAIAVPPNGIPPGCESIAPEMVTLATLTQEELDRIVAQVPGGARNVQDIYPLALLQEGILFHHLLAADADPYQVCNIVAFEEKERLDAYLRALQAVVARHDILRTSVVWQDLSEPVQVVWREAAVAVEELALDPSGADAAGQLYDAVAPRRRRHLDLAKAPLFRVWIARDAAKERWLLLMLFHQFAIDHNALSVMEQEIEAHLRGRQEQLPPPMSFRNFVATARLGVSAEEHEAFFRRMLGDVSEPTLPFGLTEVRGDGAAIVQGQLMVDGALSRRLRACARRLGVSAATIHHFAWACVVARTSGRDDVVFGTVLSGRMQGGGGAERALGLFINTLPLRIDADAESVEAGVRKTHALLAELLRHEHAPLSLAQRCSGVAPPAPLFSSLLNYRHAQRVAAATDGIERPAGIEGLFGEERTNYPLTLSVDDFESEFGLTVQAPASTDPSLVCELMHGALAAVTEALERAPATAATLLDILPPAQRRRVLEEWNATGAEYPRERSIHALFEDQAQEHPERIALSARGRELTYAALNAEANRWAHQLRALGVGPDDRVAICVERGAGMLVALLATLKAGGAYVPLDPAYPTDRLRFMLADSAPRVLLTEGAIEARFEGLSEGMTVLDITASTSDQPTANPDPHPAAADHLAYLIYTSGSTGVPKGVMVEHRAVVNLLWSIKRSLDVQPTDHLLAVTTLGFDIAALELFLPLIAGGRLTLAGRADVTDPERLAAVIATVAPTILQATPTTWRMLCDAGWPGAKELRALCGGEALSEELAGRLRPRVASLLNVYGPTETTIWSASQPVEGSTQDVAIPIGRPLANTRIYILDPAGRAVPPGVAGEIHIAGDGVARGYWNRPALTAERFLRDPFAADRAARMYKTGDLGRFRSDGTIEFLGRNDFQVKIRGVRIELGEIEARLVEHPCVREAVVVPRGSETLVAYWVASPSSELPTAEQLREQLREHLAGRLPQSMIPATFVRLEALPLTANGKLDRNALPAPAGDAVSSRPFEAPRDDAEALVARTWASVLGLSRVGRGDSFFALGGHSLQTLHVVNALRRSGVRLTVADLYAHDTVEALAAEIRRGRNALDRDPIAIRAGGSRLPLFLVHEATGSVVYASLLAPFVDAEVPVYALPPVPLDEAPLRTIPGQAARLVRMIRSVQPHGPYRIAGWSFGGILAYEIASQLIGADEVVEFLGLLDTTNAAQSVSAAAPPDERDYLLQLLEATTARQPELAPTVERIVADAKDLSIDSLIALCRESALLSGPLAGLSAEETRRALDRERLTSAAAAQYVAQPITIPISLFRASESAGDPLLGWGATLPATLIHVREVPGTHHTMFQDGHAATLGGSISAALSDPARTRSIPDEQSSPLVILQSGRRARTPLVCVPGAGANVVSFAELAVALEPALPIYGLQSRGLEGTMVPHSTIQAAARYYLEAIEGAAVRPPLHLFGHSFGGWVVLEMAHLLRAAGRRVASLTIVDSEVPIGDAPLAEYDDATTVMHLVEIFEQVVERPLGISLEQLLGRTESERRELLHQRLIEVNIMPRRSAPDVLRGPLRVFGSCLRTQYTPPGVYEMPVRLVLLDDPRLDAEANRRQQELCTEGWRKWTPTLEVWRGPGNHMTAFSRPHVNVLADWLRTKIEI